MAYGFQRKDHVNVAFLQIRYDSKKVFIILDSVVKRKDIIELLGLPEEVKHMKNPCCMMRAVMYGTTVAPSEFGQLNGRVMLDAVFQELRDLNKTCRLRR